ncbi:MAG: right-handed parallel beta-helix repeat-containing protein [Pseudomonadota bacterium]
MPLAPDIGVTRATDANVDAQSGATRTWYDAGTTTEVDCFSDVGLTIAQANPLTADAGGKFADTYLPEGTYKCIVRDGDGVTLNERDHIEIGQNLTIGVTRGYSTATLLLADTVMAYTAGAGKHLVSEGEYVQAGGFRYTVAASAAADHHLTTAGGVKLYVLKDENGVHHSDAWGITAGTDQTTQFQAMADASENGGFLIAYSGTAYITNTIVPPANCRIEIAPGVKIDLRASGTRFLQIQKENVHVWGYGAHVEADGTQNSHPIFISAGGTNIAKHCSVRGLKVTGAGSTGDDCFYIGGDVANGVIPEDIQIIDCEANGNALARNCMSIVACNGILVENFEAYGAGTAPGLGIDVEANDFMPDGTSPIRNVMIRRARCHDNPNNAGIGVVFGSEVTIEDCEIWNNSKGIVSSSGGTQFDSGVRRVGDTLGAGAFDTTDGWITVTTGAAGTDQLTDDLGIVEGMIVGRTAASGAVWPAEYTAVRYVIAEIDSTQSKIKLGASLNVGIVVPSTSGTGTLDTDPDVAGMKMNVFGRRGNSDRIKIHNCRLWNNGSLAEIELGTSRDVSITKCDIEASGVAVTLPYTSLAVIKDNRLRQTEGGSGRGIQLGSGFDHVTDGNYIENFANEGIRVDGGSGSRFGNDTLVNCGHTGNYAYRIFRCYNAVFSGPVIRQDVNHAATLGMVFDADTTNCLAVGVIARTAGNSNANSLNGAASRVTWLNCIQNDGTFKP